MDKNEIDDIREQYLRAITDYQNLKNRVAKERLDMARQIRNEILKKIIPIYDDIHKACMFKVNSGIVFILQKFETLFKEFNVEIISNLNRKAFSSDIAEAISLRITHTETFDNMIDETVSSGLKDIETNEMILYPKVIVYKFEKS